jgi:hypothetical protein
MNYTIGNKQPATWKAWLIDKNTVRLLWSLPQPVTNPPVQLTRTVTTDAEGRAGVLSILTTPGRGIACSSWALVNTGTPPGASADTDIENDEPALTDELVQSHKGSAKELRRQSQPEQ